MPEPADVSVTLAEIARLAGVGRAAVSNWRRRHDNFPTPVGGTDTSPQFSLAEVECWLREQGKLERIGQRERLWPQFEALGDRAVMGIAIAHAGERVLAEYSGGAGSPKAAPSGPTSRLVEQTVETARREGGRQTFDFLLARWLDAHVRQISATPPLLARLMADVAAVVGGEHLGATTILDPACGAGGLLLAASRRWMVTSPSSAPPILLGVELDPTLMALAAVRLGFAATERIGSSIGHHRPTVDVRDGDSLRSDPHGDAQADVVLCNPPFNERDWGHEELATDPRWVFGLPPRTEPELAWIEHALARLKPGGVAVVLLPPAVASRKAGRRIRGALLRAGALRGVIALPAGAAQPHSVSLHLWILRASEVEGGVGPRQRLFMLDAAAVAAGAAKGAQGIDWERLSSQVLDAVRAFSWEEESDSATGELPAGCLALPVMDLLDDQVDLTPARYVPETAAGAQLKLHESWSRFDGLLHNIGEYARALSRIDMSADGESVTTVTVGDLDRARALSLRTGQVPSGDPLKGDVTPEGAVPVLTVSDLVLDGCPGGWLSAADVQSGLQAGVLTIAEPGDVVVVGVERAFRVWVQVDGPLVLGSQLYALRADPEVVDPWFLAGCLRAPANVRQASSHTSSSARVDVRKLQVLQLPLAEQRPYGTAFRELLAFEDALLALGSVGTDVIRGLGDGLVAGRLHRASFPGAG
ncbi:SAM-dependent methyltransferase [Kitasatospora aureofaciens]|nr:SAM-dependent methyltransferase [Kitasatospora aureofaciens]